MITSAADRGPLEIRSTRVVTTNAYELGNMVCMTTTGWQLADNSVSDRAADGIVVSAETDEFRVVTRAGEIVPWPEHGVGTQGQLLYLDTAGGLTTTEPAGPSVVTIQLVAKVMDDDNLLLFPQNPFSL